MSESNRQIAQKAYETPSSISAPKSPFKPTLRDKTPPLKKAKKSEQLATPTSALPLGKTKSTVQQLASSLGLDETKSQQMPTDRAPVKDKGIRDYGTKDQLAILAKSLGQ